MKIFAALAFLAALTPSAFASDTIDITTTAGDVVTVDATEIEQAYYKLTLSKAMRSGSVIANPDASVSFYRPRLVISNDSALLSADENTAIGTCLRFGFSTVVSYLPKNFSTSSMFVTLSASGTVQTLADSNEDNAWIDFITCAN